MDARKTNARVLLCEYLSEKIRILRYGIANQPRSTEKIQMRREDDFSLTRKYLDYFYNCQEKNSGFSRYANDTGAQFYQYPLPCTPTFSHGNLFKPEFDSSFHKLLILLN
jgi:hypothetical protein